MDKSNSEQINGLKQEPPKCQKGGLITMPFIIANEAFERLASFGLTPNMIQYLIQDYHVSLTKGQNIIFYWNAATNFLPLIGAFVADSYLGRFLTIVFGSVFSLLGMIILWLTAMLPATKPDSSCQTCKPSGLQYLFLLSSFALMSIGAGGIRPCSLAFGADQLDKKDNPKNESILERFFGWYYASAALSIVIAMSVIVYIQDHKGFRLGFGIPVILMFFSATLFLLASSIYVKQKVKTSMFTSFAQVIAVVYKNRKLSLPSQDSDTWYSKKDSVLRVPNGRLRFMNKACIIVNTEDIGPDGTTLNPWNICTVDQVEELKIIIRVLPLWSTSIMIAINMNQGSFGFFQAKSMNRQLIGDFKIPPGSFALFTVGALFIWILVYDRILLPLASKVRGKPVHIGVKERMGIGLVLSFLAMIVSAIVEHTRHERAIEQGLLKNPTGVLNMSAYWLVPQYALNGLAEAFNAIGQTEFYYSEFPKNMSSIASCLFGLGMGVASLLASLILSTVDNVTSKGGKESWVSTNINRGHYESYYWLLAVMNFINILYFMVCSWAYGPCVEQKNGVRRENVNHSATSGQELFKPKPAQITDDGKNMEGS
ncbi:Proton-dependent oligopeptide transporter [Heracleum sosnowskyi]|uniref:Proton-dependent oligopeptide transporter n=1 Tax=Heracleum sosnowskyi TaxID=360622 RepID=A0AAD8H5Q3_9APIA|nr:Proton-dependent oligopeptide transporter [Heracleum sosnowskyi]